ncbi:circadian clock-controlled protein daywake-like [Anticarsia gemmatalis]|uniref:circadian clock-controlled protein daywake-like n=1 Tax=Anticarsia gemmatalis TaxID=129554 RepID=UPI003F7665B7
MFLFKNLPILLIVLSGCYGAVDIQKYLKVCDRNALDLNDCMVDAVRKGIKAMVPGIPDLGVPPIDPYIQKDFKVDYKNNQIAAKLSMRNINVQGMNEASVHDARVRADDDKFHLEVDLSTPQVIVSAEYYGEGQFNALKIVAEGTFNTTMTDLVFTWKLDGIPVKNGSDTFIRIKEFYMRPDVGNMYTYFANDNLESKELTDLGTRFANDNWRTLYREFLPYAQANWNKIGVKIANKIFLKVPYDQLFPSSS